jgi:hypothetical protein
MPNLEPLPDVQLEKWQSAELETTEEVPILKLYTASDLSLFWDESNDHDD